MIAISAAHASMAQFRAGTDVGDDVGVADIAACCAESDSEQANTATNTERRGTDRDRPVHKGCGGWHVLLWDDSGVPFILSSKLRNV